MTIRLGLGLGLLPASSAVVPTAPPVNVSAPAVTGIKTQGQTVTANPGSWTGTPSGAYAYQWQRWNGSSWGSISGAANQTYVLQAADVAAGSLGLRVQVTATNTIGSTSANSPAVTIAAPLTISGSPTAPSVGVSYGFTPSSAGGRTPKAFALTGTLPAGLSFNTSTGAITGTPTTSGTASGLNITVTDADGLTAALGTFSLTVGSANGTSASRYSVFGTGLRFPISNATAGAGNTYHVIESYIGTPGYDVTDPRLLFANHWQLNTGNEVQSASDIQIEWIAFKIGGAWVQAAGLPVSTAGSSWGVWTPAATGVTLPANSMIQYRVCFSLSNPAVAVPVSPKNHILSFDKSTVASTLAGLNTYKPANGATTETAVPTGTPGSIFLTPSAAVGKGGDGRPAFAIVSDSIGYGENGTSVLQSWTARREWSHIAIGLDDAAQSKRCGFVHFGIPGQSPTGTGFSNRSSWVKKLDALKYITDTYGAVPFDKVISAMGENAVSNTPQLATAIIPHYQLMTTEWGKPLIQAQLLPRTRSTDRWQTDTNQVPNVTGADEYPTGDRWVFNAACEPSGALRTGGYLADSYRTWAYVSFDQASKRDKYAARPFTATMTANYASGVITLDTAPPPGIAFEFAGDAYCTNMATTAGTDQLTLTGVTGTVRVGMTTGLGTKIIGQISGTAGGSGVYQMDTVIGFSGNFGAQGLGYGVGLIYDVSGTGPYVCTVVPIGISSPPGTGTVIREIPGDGSALHPSGRLHSAVLPQATIDWKISAGVV